MLIEIPIEAINDTFLGPYLFAKFKPKDIPMEEEIKIIVKIMFACLTESYCFFY